MKSREIEVKVEKNEAVRMFSSVVVVVVKSFICGRVYHLK